MHKPLPVPLMLDNLQTESAAKKKAEERGYFYMHLYTHNTFGFIKVANCHVLHKSFVCLFICLFYWHVKDVTRSKTQAVTLVIV